MCSTAERSSSTFWCSAKARSARASPPGTPGLHRRVQEFFFDSVVNRQLKNDLVDELGPCLGRGCYRLAEGFDMPPVRTSSSTAFRAMVVSFLVSRVGVVPAVRQGTSSLLEVSTAQSLTQGSAWVARAPSASVGVEDLPSYVLPLRPHCGPSSGALVEIFST